MRLGPLLGKGGYAKVLRGQWQNKLVAVKVQPVPSCVTLHQPPHPVSWARRLQQRQQSPGCSARRAMASTLHGRLLHGAWRHRRGHAASAGVRLGPVLEW